MKTAILQNRVSVGGRSKVMAEIIRLLNNQGHQPVLFTFSSSEEIEKFKQNYRKKSELDFHLKRPLPLAMQRGTSYQIPFLNALVYRQIRDFDLVINSNNLLYLLPEGPEYIHYIHFPAQASFKYNFPSDLKWKIYTKPLTLLYNHLSLNSRHDIYLANSDFTKEVAIEFYELQNSTVETVYPPCLDENYDIRKLSTSPHVVSLGSFNPKKRQIEQIRIAEELPELQFSIIGLKKSPNYFKSCKQFITDKEIKNVKLYPNLSSNQVQEKLKEAQFFLHTKKNEHFGISTVEAIANGCLPIVHNSGGQREIVSLSQLRFNEPSESVANLKSLIGSSYFEKQNYLSELQKQLDNYTTRTFRKRILDKFGQVDGFGSGKLSGF